MASGAAQADLPGPFVPALALAGRTRIRPRTAKDRYRHVGPFAVAVGFHVGLLTLFYLSASKVQLKIEQPPDTGAMFASLTPASSLAAMVSPQAQAQARLDGLAERISAGEDPPLQTQRHTSTPDLFQQMEAHTGAEPKSPVPPAARAAPSLAAGPSAPPLASGENPWGRASFSSADRSFTEKLWAQIKPCWRGAGPRQLTMIRLELDAGGRVQAMTSLAGAQPEAKARAQLAAQAIVACAPYKGLPPSAGAYLVSAPS